MILVFLFLTCFIWVRSGEVDESRACYTEQCSTASVVSDCCDPVDCSPTGSFVHGIFQARILEWVAIFFSRASSRPRDQTLVVGSLLRCKWILFLLSHREAHLQSRIFSFQRIHSDSDRWQKSWNSIIMWFWKFSLWIFSGKELIHRI